MIASPVRKNAEQEPRTRKEIGRKPVSKEAGNGASALPEQHCHDQAEEITRYEAARSKQGMASCVAMRESDGSRRSIN